MPFQGLYSEFVDCKALERLTAASKEVGQLLTSDASVFTPKTDIKQIKEILRNSHWGVDHPIRKNLWEVLCNNISTEDHSELYYDVEKELFGETYLPSSLPSFVDPAYCIRYYLNAEGRKRVEKILHVIRHIKPDITYCPVIYPLVSLLLHYMSDGMAFSCILKLLADRQNYISQTKSDHASSAYLVMKLTKKYARNAFLQLEKELKEHEDLESMFQNWLSWIFKGLPFSYLIRIVDCFLIEKKKTLYRAVIAVLVLYSKHADKDINEDLGAMQKLLDFSQNIPVPVEKVFKVAYGIRGFSERVMNQQLLKVQMMLKSQSNMNMRSMSADRLDPADSIYHVEVNSAAQPIVRELRLDSSARTRSVGVVALGSFKSGIITAEQMSIIWEWLPLRVSMLQPEVIYSSNEHGVCLTAFYMTVGNYEPTVLVIKAMNDEIFGAYCSSSWNTRNSCDSENKKHCYFGSGETFLFTLVPEAQKFAWVGCTNTDDVPHSAQLFMAADSNMINVGAGNGQGILLDDQLLHGRTDRCDTFNNKPLCSSKDFQCKVVEVIGFK
ncbi:LOW QUALITY PROTEIN: GTPase-activating protein skywalker-like [Uloborus diversus]|uniref:LOW QUALITY PROTEIN: GTPase-activating protein skywalker-like n=1 Tax=Uloborus diversus TaxID=327109 RepID=UPI0024091FF2|nr:LOW QUALITY PROTEIN: GTPase-activating protein skywalker-like [Uloborus diversus]